MNRSRVISVSDIGTAYDRASDVALQRDGKIVVAGEALTDRWHFVVARVAGADFGFSDFASDVAIQRDGKIVVAGSARQRFVGTEAFGVARFNSDGSPARHSTVTGGR